MIRSASIAGTSTVPAATRCDLVARTGRQQQRYRDGHRLIAGCVPFRYRERNEDGVGIESTLEVLMINSQSGPGLLFPKGGWEKDETVEEAAAREAVEEAGVRGDIMKFLGHYYFKSKSQQDEDCPDGQCEAAMFALLVKEELSNWPEQSTRKRRWLKVADALQQCRHAWMEEALESFSGWQAIESSSSALSSRRSVS